MCGPESGRFVHLTLVLALANQIKVKANYHVMDLVMMEGCAGEEQSTGHKLDFLKNSLFTRKRAGARTHLLREIGIAGSQSDPCCLEI